MIGKIEELERLGVTQFVVGSPIGREKAKAIKMIGEKVISHFNVQ